MNTHFPSKLGCSTSATFFLEHRIVAFKTEAEILRLAAVGMDTIPTGFQSL